MRKKWLGTGFLLIILFFSYFVPSGSSISISNMRIMRVFDKLMVFENKPVSILLNESVSLINGTEIRNLGVIGKGVRVCIVDTGIDYNHPSLQGKVISQIDIFNGDADAFDDNGHGTHVAGIIASNDEKYMGVSPGVSLLIAKVLGNGGWGLMSHVISGLEWCVNQEADVISMSLGGVPEFDCNKDPMGYAVNYIVREKDIPVVVAAGNNGEWGITTPACASEAIAVGAVDKNKKLAYFSSRGKELDIVAPGVSIISTFPYKSFRSLSGTSMATPHVSGVIALLLENGTLSVDNIKRIIYGTTTLPICDKSYCQKRDWGWGLINILNAYNRNKIIMDEYGCNLRYFTCRGDVDYCKFKFSRSLSKTCPRQGRLESGENYKKVTHCKYNKIARNILCTMVGYYEYEVPTTTTTTTIKTTTATTITVTTTPGTTTTTVLKNILKSKYGCNIKRFFNCPKYANECVYWFSRELSRSCPQKGILKLGENYKSITGCPYIRVNRNIVCSMRIYYIN